jgi:hypothetical protein
MPRHPQHALLRLGLGALATGACISASCDGGARAPAAMFSSRVLKRDEVASTKWLQLQTIHYIDQTGRQRLWDVCTRTTRAASSSSSGVDAVVILARLRTRAEPNKVRIAWPCWNPKTFNDIEASAGRYLGCAAISPPGEDERCALFRLRLLYGCKVAD